MLTAPLSTSTDTEPARAVTGVSTSSLLLPGCSNFAQRPVRVTYGGRMDRGDERPSRSPGWGDAGTAGKARRTGRHAGRAVPQDRGPRPALPREIVGRLLSLVLGALALGLATVGVVGIATSLASALDVPFEQTTATFVFTGVLPLVVAGQLWARWRPPLARAVAGGPIPVRFAGDVTRAFAGRRGSGGGIFLGGGGDGGGSGGCGGGGGGC